MSADVICLKLFQIEQILNEYSGKRYHIITLTTGRHNLVEVKRIGKEKLIVQNLTSEMMYSYLKKYLKVELKNE
jgi:hypothetical protein